MMMIIIRTNINRKKGMTQKNGVTKNGPHDNLLALNL